MEPWEYKSLVIWPCPDTDLLYSNSPVFSFSDFSFFPSGFEYFLNITHSKIAYSSCFLIPSGTWQSFANLSIVHLLVLFLLQVISEMAIRRFCVIRMRSISAIILISLISMLPLLLIMKKDRRFENQVTRVRLIVTLKRHCQHDSCSL